MYIKNSKLYIKIYRKQIDRQNFFRINSEHPILLKYSISYSQALRIKLICTTSKDFEHHCKDLNQRFLEQGYNLVLLEKHTKTVRELDRNELIKVNKKDTPINSRIPLEITYNQFLNISKIFRKKLNILSVNISLRKVFQNEPITAFKRNKNLREFIGSNKIESNIVKR